MADLTHTTVVCAACNAESQQVIFPGAERTGSPDLDLRPADPQRSTMAYWLQECPHCGYVSPDLSQIDDGIREALQSPQYKALLEDETVPPLVRRFRKASLISEMLNQPETAAVTALWTAWAADDAGEVAMAEQARLRAAGLFGLAPNPTEPEAAEGRLARVVDILRRAGRFDAAEELAAAAMENGVSDLAMQVLTFQRIKCAEQDRDVYRVDQATGEQASSQDAA